MFDFYTSKKVRKDGKSLSKFDLALELDELKPVCNWTVIYDAFSYAELRDQLITYLRESVA